MNTLNEKSQLQEMAGYCNHRKNKIPKRKPTAEQKAFLNAAVKGILKLKHAVDSKCAGYDKYVFKHSLKINPIKNPYNSNRLNELEQSYVNHLTLGGCGAGLDTEEGLELKVGDWRGLNIKTNKLNSIPFYFNGMGRMESDEEQEEYVDDYFSKIPELALAIRCEGNYIHFRSKMTVPTIELLKFSTMRSYFTISEDSRDPRIRATITSSKLIEMKNFKLLENTDEKLARKYLGSSYEDVT